MIIFCLNSLEVNKNRKVSDRNRYFDIKYYLVWIKFRNVITNFLWCLLESVDYVHHSLYLCDVRRAKDYKVTHNVLCYALYTWHFSIIS